MATKAILKNHISCEVHGYVRVPRNFFADDMGVTATKFCPACAIEAGHDIDVLEYDEDDFDLYNSLEIVSDDMTLNLLWNGRELKDP